MFLEFVFWGVEFWEYLFFDDNEQERKKCRLEDD